MAGDWTMDQVEKLYATFRPAAMANRGKTLLVADSDESHRAFFCGQMQQKGFSVVTAENSLEAVRIIHDRHPDCCVLDLALQPVSGLDILETLSRDEDYANMLVFLSSGNLTREDRILAQIYRAQDVLKKPLQAGVIAQKIGECFTDREQQNNLD